MAISFYDDAMVYKIKHWLPENSTLRVLGPSESKRLFETTADDNKDAPLQLPFVALSRNTDVELLLNIKNLKSFDGFTLFTTEDDDATAKWNIIPIKLMYQMDIYAKTSDDAEEYMRNFLFKIINNPTMIIDIPYNNLGLRHRVNIRVQSTVSDTSDIAERLFPGQFHRWTIQMELQDAFLFNVPYRKNWKLDGIELETYPDTPPLFNPSGKEVEWRISMDELKEITKNNETNR